MGIIAVEGIVEKGQVRLQTDLNVPDHTKVYVIVPAQSNLVYESELAPSFPMSLREILAPPKIEPGQEPKLSDFAGLGADLWEQIDVDEYIEEERNSWDRSFDE
jgi:hypothetical protein